MEDRVHAALDYLDSYPTAKIATVAHHFRITRAVLRNRIAGRGRPNRPPPSNMKIKPIEKQAICNYINRLDRINLSVRAKFIEEAANRILKARANPLNSTPPSVGKMWVTRFIQRHRYLQRLQKKLDSNRTQAENIEAVNEYFRKLQDVIVLHSIMASDIWNIDETGFRIGMGNNAFVITKRKRANYFALPKNRESATSVEAINTIGKVIPSFLILAGQLHMAHWYRTPEIPNNIAITVSPTGYSNDYLSLEWLKHFEKHTKPLQIGSKRLLILDSYGSHHTKDFAEYCEDHQIIPFGLPPHSTHILQPLDVAVFQPLKHYHTKALDIIVQDRITNITKLEFLGLIQQVRIQAFKPSTIISAFKKTGIHPFNPHLVLQQLEERASRENTPPSQSTPNLPSSPPAPTPTTLRHVKKATYHIEEALKSTEGINSDLASSITKFIKGSILNATEVHQLRADLSRTKYAQEISKSRRASKNTPLKSGGVLTVEEGRRIANNAVETELEKARRLVEAAEERFKKATQRAFENAAKEARKWRLTGRLLPALIINRDCNCRYLRRF